MVWLCKTKYGAKATFCCMDTDSFTVCIKTNNIYKEDVEDLVEDVETKSDTSNCEWDRPLPKGKNKKVIGLMKDELDGKFLKKFVGLRAKSYSYLIHDSREDKNNKRTHKKQ